MTLLGSPQFGSRTAVAVLPGAARTDLPRWPFAAMFVLFPLWWVLGFGEMMWIPLAAVMVTFMVKAGGIRVPRGYGLWLLFLVLVFFSVIGIDTSGRLTGFIYRALYYLVVTIVFVYVYNARGTLTIRYVLGVLTVFWTYVAVGGYLGMLFPLFSFVTPLAYVIPDGLQSNELIREIVVRRLTQYNPEGWVVTAPRPSAPFLYTNGWGNVYSMLLPIVVAYLGMLRSGWRQVLLFLGIVASLVPAFASLNRGMFIGIGVAIVYTAVRLALRKQVKLLLGVLVAVALLVSAALLLDVGSRLDERIESSSTTQDRADLYVETFERTMESPIFGYGAPRPSVDAGAPSAGTQGQVWTVMFSHGFPAFLLFMSWLAYSFFATIRARDPALLALNTVLLVILVEVFYYGVLPDGLILSMTAAALAMREGKGTPLLGER